MMIVVVTPITDAHRVGERSRYDWPGDCGSGRYRARHQGNKKKFGCFHMVCSFLIRHPKTGKVPFLLRWKQNIPGSVFVSL
jgi:hypothetical protein